MSSRSAKQRDGALVVLDAWALLAFLKGEPAASRVEAAWIEQPVAMSAINVGEALYLRMRERGSDIAREEVRKLRSYMTVVDASWDLVSAAAEIKARGGLSYADAFCIATAQRLDAPLLTGDPEILAFSDEAEMVDLSRSG